MPYQHPWPEIAKVAVISTTHMSNEDAERAGEPTWPCIASSESGCIFAALDYQPDRDPNEDYYKKLYGILLLAFADGVDYVWFHPDGHKMDGLPVFD